MTVFLVSRTVLGNSVTDVYFTLRSAHKGFMKSSQYALVCAAQALDCDVNDIKVDDFAVDESEQTVTLTFNNKEVGNIVLMEKIVKL